MCDLEVCNDLGIWGQLSCNVPEALQGRYFETWLGGGANSRIELDFVWVDAFYGVGDFGDLVGSGVDVVDEEDLEPDLAGVLAPERDKAVDEFFNSDIRMRTVNFFEGGLVGGIEAWKDNICGGGISSDVWSEEESAVCEECDGNVGELLYASNEAAEIRIEGGFA